MNRIRIILRENTTLWEMLIGVAVSDLLLLIGALIFTDDKLMSSLGVIEGMILACYYCIHMAVAIDDALCLDEKGATAQMQKHMIIRYVVVCVTVALVAILHIGDPIFCVVACLFVKIGAYMQPFVHKILHRSEEVSSETDETDGSENGGRISE